MKYEETKTYYHFGLYKVYYDIMTTKHEVIKSNDKNVTLLSTQKQSKSPSSLYAQDVIAMNLLVQYIMSMIVCGTLILKNKLSMLILQ